MSGRYSLRYVSRSNRHFCRASFAALLPVRSARTPSQSPDKCWWCCRTGFSPRSRRERSCPIISGRSLWANSAHSLATGAGPGFRPIEASTVAVCYARNTSILLKKSEIEPSRKSRFRARRLISGDSPHGRACRSRVRGKTGRSAEPPSNSPSRLPAVV